MDKKDNKQMLKDAYEKHQKNMSDLMELGLKLVAFEATEEFKEYENYTQEEKKEKFLEQYEMYTKKEELLGEIDYNRDYVIKAAKVFNKELNDKITQTKNEIENNNKLITEQNNIISNIKVQINALVESEEYKNSDADVEQKVMELESELQRRIRYVQDLKVVMQNFETELKKLNDAQVELKTVFEEEYSASLEEVVEPKKEIEKENSPNPISKSLQPNNENKEKEQVENTEGNTDKPKTEKVKQRSNNANVRTVYVGVEQESKPKEDKTKTLEEEFVELYDKAKNNRLNEKDFARFAEIMKDPKNYDKLNITTGVIFNKAKVIFKAMGKVVSVDNLNFKNASEKLEKEIAKANAVMSKDRDTLSADEKIEWDRAKQQIEQYNILLETMEVYNGVCDSRQEARWAWFTKLKNKQNVKKIADKSITVKEVAKSSNLADTLAGQVNPLGKENSTTYPPKSTDEQVK